MKNRKYYKKIKNLILVGISSIIILLHFIECKTDNEDENKIGPDDDINYEIVIVNNHTVNMLEAIGVELDPHFFSQNVTRDDGSKASDWNYVVDRVKKMGIHKFRVMALPQWYEPENDNDDPNTTNWDRLTFDSQEMQSLYKVLDLAQEQNIDICIVLWGCPTVVSLLDPNYANVEKYFMTDPNKGGWVTGPVDYDEWAENFFVLIKYLIEERGYTCVNEITPLNEPNGINILTSAEYIKMVKILDARFKKEGLRSKVRFNLSDNTDRGTTYLVDCVQNLQDIADIFNSHNYIFGYDTPNKEIYDWEKNNAVITASVKKKHFVGEFGTYQIEVDGEQKDIDLYVRGVLMTRLVLNFLNAGACGVSYWILFDQFYDRNEGDQYMKQLGLWKYIKETYEWDSDYFRIQNDYEVRPQYYSYSLLTRFVKPGAEIYPIDLDEDFVIGTAFKDKEGKWTYVFANGTDESKYLAIQNEAMIEKFDIYRYEEDKLPQNGNQILASENLKVNSNQLQVEVRGNSVVLCRQQ